MFGPDQEKRGNITPESGYCINCDNRHGCKSGTPPCLVKMRQQGVKNESGKEYLMRTGGIAACGQCPFFRSCWNGEEYDRRIDGLRGEGA